MKLCSSYSPELCQSVGRQREKTFWESNLIGRQPFPCSAEKHSGNASITGWQQDDDIDDIITGLQLVLGPFMWDIGFLPGKWSSMFPTGGCTCGHEGE